MTHFKISMKVALCLLSSLLILSGLPSAHATPPESKPKGEKVEIEWESYSGEAELLFKHLIENLTKKMVEKCGSTEKVQAVHNVSISNAPGKIAGADGQFIPSGTKEAASFYLDYPLLRASALVECKK